MAIITFANGEDDRVSSIVLYFAHDKSMKVALRPYVLVIFLQLVLKIIH